MPVLQLVLCPAFLFVIILFALITVPQGTLRRLFPYGVTLGGLLNVTKTYILKDLLGLIHYRNLGVFDCGGQMFFAPLIWTFLIILFLYFWPRDNQILAGAYFLAWAILAAAFGQVLKNAELFACEPWLYPLPKFLIFAGRFALTIWVVKPWRRRF
ncbi:MAG TPA: hypothetical protein GX528_04275 [Firmicutes bacterium]|nr:hypothetical protein [Bacillota bacterium]